MRRNNTNLVSGDAGFLGSTTDELAKSAGNPGAHSGGVRGCAGPVLSCDPCVLRGGDAEARHAGRAAGRPSYRRLRQQPGLAQRDDQGRAARFYGPLHCLAGSPGIDHHRRRGGDDRRRSYSGSGGPPTSGAAVPLATARDDPDRDGCRRGNHRHGWRLTARAAVNATISSLLLYYIMLGVFSFLVEGPLRDPATTTKFSTPVLRQAQR